MAGYGYSYRIYNPYDGFDPRKTERSHNSEQLYDPAFDDAEGRRFIAGDPSQNTGTYVMKIETTVERVHPSTFSEYYRQCSPPRYEHRRSYGVVNEKLHGPLIRSNDQLPLAGAAFNKIQNEASQPSGFSAPRIPYQLRIPVSAGYHGNTGDPGDSDREKERHKSFAGTIKDKEADRGDLRADKILKPPVTTEAGKGDRHVHPTGPVRPSHHTSSETGRTIQPPSKIMTGRWERHGPNMELSPTMNDIGTAMEYLKKVADPSSVNTNKDEVPDCGYLKGDKVSKPPVATEGGPAATLGPPTGSMPPNYYSSFGRGERTIQPPPTTMTGGWERHGHDLGLVPMSETGKTMEYSKEAMKPTSVSTIPKREAIPETIDSKEARRRHEAVNPSPEPYATGFPPTIDSRAAARKYNGQSVPK